MDQIKGKLTKMNPRKGFCNLILCFVIFCIIAGVGTMAKFGSRILEMKKQIQIMENTSEEQGQNLVREKTERIESIRKTMKLTGKTQLHCRPVIMYLLDV